MKKRSLSRLKIIFPLYSYPVHVFIALLFVVMLVFVTQYIQNELYQFYFIPGISVFSALSLLTPWIGRYLHKTFQSLQETIETLTETSQKEWFMQQEYFIFGLNRWSILISLIVAKMCIRDRTNSWHYSNHKNWHYWQFGIRYF